MRRARELAGLDLAELAATTRIPVRSLQALEEGNYSALAARTYATGFARSYARAVGLDEKEIVAAVRVDLAELDPDSQRHSAATFEPGDPARVPSARTAWLAALGALGFIIAGLLFWRSYYLPGGELPSLLPRPAPAPVASPAPPPPAARPTGGAVVFTALEPGVWVKFYDAAGKELMQKQLAQGESYTVPAEAEGPQLWTGRPEALEITVGGQSVPKLSDVQRTMKDVPVTAEALLARSAPVPAGAASPAVAISPTAPRPQGRQRLPRQDVERPQPSPIPVEGPPPAAVPVAAPTMSQVGPG